MPEIEIDDEVFELLRRNAEVFVDQPNTVLRRLLGLDANGHVVTPTAVARSATGSTTSPQPLRQPVARRGPGRPAKPRRKRAAHGTLLPESEYEMPILRYLDQQDGGRAPSREVIEAVGQELDEQGRLEPADKETLSSGEVRWKSRAGFVRLRLVERGQVDGQAPRGTWQITDQGRQRVRAEAKSEQRAGAAQ